MRSLYESIMDSDEIVAKRFEDLKHIKDLVDCILKIKRSDYEPVIQRSEFVRLFFQPYKDPSWVSFKKNVQKLGFKYKFERYNKSHDYIYVQGFGIYITFEKNDSGVLFLSERLIRGEYRNFVINQLRPYRM